MALAIGTGASAASAAPAFAQAPAKVSPARAATVTSSVAKVTYDGSSFMIDGKRTYLWSGEYHYFRQPSPDLWLDTFQKMKAAGFNSVSLYFDWGYHSPKQGVYDFTGVRDLDKLLDYAEQAGLYVIARPPAYINAEVDGGGLPGWMSVTKGKNRSADPDYLRYQDEWMTQVDKIIARHQITNGTGSVIAYQAENEYYNGSAEGRTYMAHLRDKAKVDGITVPIIGNHNGIFNSGDGALDVDGVDSYPQGFNCSNPTAWRPVPNISSGWPSTKPLSTIEFQGGAFDPWGGPGFDKCAQLINDQFANVFYKQNIAVGATTQNIYMLFGGTNWGWLGRPEGYTSYDYGAAIRETRQLDPKYYENKLIGYLVQAAKDLRDTKPMLAETGNQAIVDTARVNPETGAQFHTLRHRDSTATSTDSTTLSLDLAAKPVDQVTYTWDDADPALSYTGAWEHVADQSYTQDNYRKTESFSRVAGDRVKVTFTGTAVRWIGTLASNHGTADVLIDGAKVATVDTAGSPSGQKVLFSTAGLSAGEHTLEIVVTGTRGEGSSDTYVPVDAIDVPSAADATQLYPRVPQQAGTDITLLGRDSDILLANYVLQSQRLQYSTSELLTDAKIGDHDLAVLYGEKGTDGETVLRFASRPTVTVDAGGVTSTWDATRGDLRLNYTHGGIARVTITGGGSARPLQLLLTDKATAKTFWRLEAGDSPVIVRGTALLRTAELVDGTAVLSGDNDDTAGIEVWADATSVTWNGKAVKVQRTPTGSLTGAIPVRRAVTLPELSGWRRSAESPEAAYDFDDSRWVTATKTTTQSVSGAGELPVLYADDYGFHTGNTWYRGRFQSTGKETGIHLESISGGATGDVHSGKSPQAFSVWLNGTFLGSYRTGSADITFPKALVRGSGDNVVSVLTVNMGHNNDYNSSNENKTARGLTSAYLLGSPLTRTTWRLQGVRGGEDLFDTVRGPLANGGLYGERAGWSLPGFPDQDWSPVTLPAADPRPGVTWYRTTAALDLPKDQDTSVGVTITDDPSRRYRAQIFVNGWQVGNYLNDVGPQRSFPVPVGILNPNGANTIAIAVWNLDGSTGGLGKVALTSYGSHTSSLRVGMNDSPRYSAAKYAMPAAPGVAVSMTAPSTTREGATFTVRATASIPADRPSARDISARLTAPAGWTVGRVEPASVAQLSPGSSATFTWRVTAPAKIADPAALTAAITAIQAGRSVTVEDTRIVGGVPPAPGPGEVAVSDLPFMSATNGWGPVERDQSNGEAAAGDGSTISIRGTTFAKGLGTNAVSVVKVYLGGACTRFTASVGIDDEIDGGSVTFTVGADGHDAVTTPVLTRRDAVRTLDVDVTGAQVLTLTVGDGGDGNGADHGSWGAPTLTCT
ncbi:beta-galactosidase [Knoellia koreensis]|uniref:beta-galactosidase n=1 Tax=Knoellia koreensis TaxID=2730921 RepID=UPI00197F05AE